jgi:hypothetical protein
MNSPNLLYKHLHSSVQRSNTTKRSSGGCNKAPHDKHAPEGVWEVGSSDHAFSQTPAAPRLSWAIHPLNNRIAFN